MRVASQPRRRVLAYVSWRSGVLILGDESKTCTRIVSHSDLTGRAVDRCDLCQYFLGLGTRAEPYLISLRDMQEALP